MDKVYYAQDVLEDTELVYGKEITFINDVNNKDDIGRLVRCLLVGDIFANLDTVEVSLCTMLDILPDSACAETFKQAEQVASGSMLDLWSPTVTPRSP